MSAGIQLVLESPSCVMWKSSLSDCCVFGPSKQGSFWKGFPEWEQLNTSGLQPLCPTRSALSLSGASCWRSGGSLWRKDIVLRKRRAFHSTLLEKGIQLPVPKFNFLGRTRGCSPPFLSSDCDEFCPSHVPGVTGPETLLIYFSNGQDCPCPRKLDFNN